MTQDSGPDGSSKKRVRLPADERRQQILDAALVEFSSVGFEGATVERISQRVGLTKAGLYAHFVSKDAILDALLVDTIFSPSNQNHWQWVDGATVEETIDQFLQTAYAAIAEPRSRAIFRLLITESGRSPERLRNWHEHILLPHALRRQEELDKCVAKGVIPNNAVSRKFYLASAPVVVALLTYLLLGEELAEQEVAEIRSAHREMLLLLFARGDL